MRPEWRFGLAAAAALAAGVVLAEPYARLAAPYYGAVDRLIARGHPWVIREVAVTTDRDGQDRVLRLVGEVRRDRTESRPAALVVTRVQIGEAIETPIVFWGLLLAWPAAGRRERWLRMAVGLVVFLGIEAITTATQLVHSMAAASAQLEHAYSEDPLTLWERWSRFLEAGGTFVVAAVGALVAIAVSTASDSQPRGG